MEMMPDHCDDDELSMTNIPTHISSSSSSVNTLHATVSHNVSDTQVDPFDESKGLKPDFSLRRLKKLKPSAFIAVGQLAGFLSLYSPTTTRRSGCRSTTPRLVCVTRRCPPRRRGVAAPWKATPSIGARG
jgi:hypothetical protein